MNAAPQIPGADAVVAGLGDWPSFHDAEVVELRHWRGQMKSGDWDDSNVLPLLTAKIHIFKENPTSQHTLATLRFEDVDDYRMEGFNHQNAILGLSITVQNRAKFESGESLPPYLLVAFQPAFGMSASFSCFRIEVVDAVRCSGEGKVLPNQSPEPSAVDADCSAARSTPRIGGGSGPSR